MRIYGAGLLQETASAGATPAPPTLSECEDRYHGSFKTGEKVRDGRFESFGDAKEGLEDKMSEARERLDRGGTNQPLRIRQFKQDRNMCMLNFLKLLGAWDRNRTGMVLSTEGF